LHKTAGKPRGALRALSDWLLGTSLPPQPEPSAPPAGEATPSRIGHYAIEGLLGRGGMGTVYAARDERLGRTVAVKTISSLAADDTARRRFWREARAAASVNHPNVCQLYEVGEDAGTLFIAMELLEGEPLSARLRRGALSVSEMLPVGRGILAALQALHARGIVHRDLKPSNVFLTPHGVKLLDFGLARAADTVAAEAESELTRTGMVLGTPRYMAPEQVTGEGLDARSDLFSLGAILFESLAGRPAFDGRSAVEILHATLYEQPPALTGSAAVAAADRVIRRALAKRPAERPPSAEAMAGELRAVEGVAGGESTALARPLTRIVVLPFRILRPDPETDFLAFSLPDAIATSLSRIGSLVVRSTAAGARFAGEAPDLKALAVEADVDRVVMGILVRAGGEVRVSAQLVDAPQGTLLASHAAQSSLGDLFSLQDEIARRVVETLALPLGVSDQPTPEAPHDAAAYSLYLRANELARRYERLPAARELYEECLRRDPGFAPAWAQLGRCHRVIGKFLDGSGDSEGRAEEAFRRALALDPQLAIAHRHYAHLEAETGKPLAALLRLLAQAARHRNDAELFAGLVHACRYCGLLEQALAAHEEARRLDPNVPSSLEQTLLMTGDVERLLAAGGQATHDAVIRVIGLGLAGRVEEGRSALPAARAKAPVPALQRYVDSLEQWLAGDASKLLAGMESLGELRIVHDPEAMFQTGWLLCHAGAHEPGLAQLERAVRTGYAVAGTLATAPAFAALRGEARFQALVATAEAERQRALTVFRENGGERLLGL
jgi:serine/threonine protein kinase/tetratricopeptide (TPR) repeat protein